MIDFYSIIINDLTIVFYIMSIKVEKTSYQDKCTYDLDINVHKPNNKHASSYNSYKNKLFVELHDFDINNVRIIKDQLKTKYQFYHIKYIYGGNERSESEMIDKLRLYCDAIKMRSNRYRILPRDNVYYRYINVPFDNECEQYKKMENIIQLIKSKIIEYIIKESDAKIIIRMKNNIYFQSESDGTLKCDVIKLEGISKDNINVKLKTIKDINKIITDFKYNKINSESYYRSNSLIWFKCVLIEDNMKDVSNVSNVNSGTMHLSINPCIDIMELYYNKAKCTSTLDYNEKIMVTDNILIL